MSFGFYPAVDNRRESCFTLCHCTLLADHKLSPATITVNIKVFAEKEFSDWRIWRKNSAPGGCFILMLGASFLYNFYFYKIQNSFQNERDNWSRGPLPLLHMEHPLLRCDGAGPAGLDNCTGSGLYFISPWLKQEWIVKNTILVVSSCCHYEMSLSSSSSSSSSSP